MPPRKLRTSDLRDELLQCAVMVLEQEGPVAVRARRVASAAGTSTGALYELFGDKTGLVRGIFYEGFRMLAARLHEVPNTSDARANVVALLEGSRAFALEHPMLFEVMYARPFGEFDPTPDDLRVGRAVYDLVVREVRRWLAQARSGADAVDAAHALVALNRGLVATELAGLLGRSVASRERRWQLAIAAQLDGLERTTRSRDA
ncbi:MAG: TetR/AcrR family transcriptional regulator [Acidimicrobiaceae bacterium]|nr:TetR/AcrR family transcriptional regulator [Acidimicrobiaceae bacterium]